MAKTTSAASRVTATGVGVTSTRARTTEVRLAANRGPRGSMPQPTVGRAVERVDMVLLTTDEGLRGRDRPQSLLSQDKIAGDGVASGHSTSDERTRQ